MIKNGICALSFIFPQIALCSRHLGGPQVPLLSSCVSGLYSERCAAPTGHCQNCSACLCVSSQDTVMGVVYRKRRLTQTMPSPLCFRQIPGRKSPIPLMLWKVQDFFARTSIYLPGIRCSRDRHSPQTLTSCRERLSLGQAFLGIPVLPKGSVFSRGLRAFPQTDAAEPRRFVLLPNHTYLVVDPSRDSLHKNTRPLAPKLLLGPS